MKILIALLCGIMSASTGFGHTFTSLTPQQWTEFSQNNSQTYLGGIRVWQSASSGSAAIQTDYANGSGFGDKVDGYTFQPGVEIDFDLYFEGFGLPGAAVALTGFDATYVNAFLPKGNEMPGSVTLRIVSPSELAKFTFMTHDGEMFELSGSGALMISGPDLHDGIHGTLTSYIPQGIDPSQVAFEAQFNQAVPEPSGLVPIVVFLLLLWRLSTMRKVWT